MADIPYMTVPLDITRLDVTSSEIIALGLDKPLLYTSTDTVVSACLVVTFIFLLMVYREF